jgi:hypothetical protein
MRRNTRSFWEGQVELALAKLAELSAYGEDNFEEGAVIRFTYIFRPHGTEYSYAAIKCNNLWYTTGPRAPKAYTWEDLVAWWIEAHNFVADTIEVAKKWRDPHPS